MAWQGFCLMAERFKRSSLLWFKLQEYYCIGSDFVNNSYFGILFQKFLDMVETAENEDDQM
jgi:hypothetical protein